jgi:hypothetical protein
VRCHARTVNGLEHVEWYCSFAAFPRQLVGHRQSMVNFRAIGFAKELHGHAESAPDVAINDPEAGVGRVDLPAARESLFRPSDWVASCPGCG